LRIIGHFDKTETLGATRVTFHHDFGAGDGTVGCKRLLQIIITERIWQIADVKFVAHERTPQNNSKRDGVHNRNQQTSKDLRSRRETDIHRKPCTALKNNTGCMIRQVSVFPTFIFRHP
jgi:hypothetical protein